MNLNMENGSVRSSIENVPSTTQSTITLDRKDDDKDEKNDYNPFEHRDVVHPTSTLGAFFHLLKSSLGSGLLAMPAAFRNTGLIPGCIGTILVGVIATHCVHILVSTSRAVSKNCRAPSLSYTDTCEEVFKQGPKKLQQYSKHIRHFVDAAMAGVCLGGTSVYVIFIASSLKDICDHFVPSKKFEVEVYCGILLLPLILITQIRHLKFLVPFSVLANVCLVVTFGITCFYTFTDLKPLENIEMVASVEKWPLFLSTAIFAMEGINVVMPVENEMAKPQHFLGCPSVLNVTMVFVTILYGVVGIFGYMKYGEGVLGSITLNLPEGENLALTAKILVAVAVFFTYCLQMYAPMDIIWTRIKCRISKNYFNISQITLRTLSVTLTVVLAVAVPDLELLIGLVGAIFFSTLGLLIPVVVQTVHLWEKGLGKFSYILWKNALLLIFYFIVLVSGCYTAVSEIILKFR
ncbi:proton-coupled amino acid transporter-like protein pathetic isoform X1 [Helicoverpa zea]|uniref:proton-coupled amino acid transporter-like protein pathetic isoform X1 n=2 Tax=Helicoverpa zea TaxID=7113 RepID=UPI001F58A0DD|nr:proton-coupled amino acid transporter-like protein pathetic isoform X1 [Helicoverpa zea]